MVKQAVGLLALIGLSGSLFAAHPTQVKFETSYGDITIELDSAKAPKTVANFLGYVNDKFYDGTIFHRITNNYIFVIQGGGMTPDLNEKPTKPPVVNEADNELPNLRGTISMARLPEPNSASSQFFINYKDNPGLNFRKKTIDDWGYCVFGKIIKGMEVVDSIAKTPTGMNKGMENVPVQSITIKKAYVVVAKAVVKPKAPAAATAKKDSVAK